MTCPKCGNSKYIKNGIVGGKQRYKCKECSFNYTVSTLERGIAKNIRKMALMMYLEGLGFRSIERLLGISHVSVMNWVKKFGNEIHELKTDSKIDWVELDEMHTYVGSKKTTVGFGLLLTDMESALSTVFLVQGEKIPLNNSGVN